MYHLRRIKVLLAACLLVGTSLWAQDTKIPISSAVATSEQSDEEAKLAIDGSAETYWHSQWSWGAVLDTHSSVDLTIAFSEVMLVDYVRYIPRQDRLEQGCWGEVEVFYSSEPTGTNFSSVGTFQLEKQGMTYDFFLNGMEGVQCGQIKFTIRSAGNNHVTAAEIEAYKIDKTILTKYQQYFTDGVYSELKSGVTSSDGITDADVKALVDNMLSDAEGYKKFRVGEYEPYMTTATVKSDLKLSNQYNNYENPTGVYLEAGQSCYVAVSGIGSYPIGLKIKDWYLSKNESSYPLHNGLNYITATTEGNVFVCYYTDDFENAPNVKVHFINAPVLGYWDSETMENADWEEMLAGPLAKADRIIITRSEHAQLAYPIGQWKLHNPTDIKTTMEFYQQVQWAERDMLGLEQYGRQVKNRQLFYGDNSGRMAAGGDAAYCGYSSLEVLMVPDAKRFDFWGVGHEWGHNNQMTPGFKWTGCGETTNNIPASWAQFHFTGNRDANGHPTYLRLEDEVTGIGEYIKMRGGRMQTYFEESLRKGVAWQLQDGPDYYGETPTEVIVDGQDESGNSTGSVSTTWRHYDHFVKLVPFWQLNLWGTLAGKSPEIIQKVIESIRTTENYGLTYNTNGKQQINWMKLACDVTQIDLLPFFEMAGMLRPIHAYIDDYTKGWNIITEAMIAELEAYVAGKGYPAFTEEINYINGHNYRTYRDKLKLVVPETLGTGCTLNGNFVTVQHSDVQHAVAFETYNADDELIRITMYGLGSDDAHSYTKVLYPSSEGASYIKAVGYDGDRKIVYKERDEQELQALIDEAGALMGEIGEVSGEYTEQKVNLSAGNYYCNALYTASEGNDKFTSYDVLCDGKPETYLHTDYSNSDPTEDHYVTIDLGDGNELTFFNLTYRTRKDGSVHAPSSIVIEGSNDNATWALLREVSSGLKTGNNQENTIEKLGDGTPYRYIRMKVLAASSGKRFFVLSELGLSKLQYEVDLKPEYSSISEDVVVATYHAIQSAQGKMAEGEGYTSAYVALQKMYNALYAAKNTVKYKVYTVQVVGVDGMGGVTYGDKAYANGDTIHVATDITVDQLTAQAVDGYNEGVVSIADATITVTYTMIPLVDTTKYYTLRCWDNSAHGGRFISDDGTAFNGHSTVGTLFQFEAADEYNGYYIKSYASGKYLSADGTSVVASAETSTVWTMEASSHTEGAMTLTIGNDNYLNNNGNASNSCPYLQIKNHPGGPGSGAFCSLWKLTEGEPIDRSEFNELMEEVEELIASCYTDGVLNYVNSAYVNETSMTNINDAVAAAQTQCDNATTVAAYNEALEALRSAKYTLSSNITLANAEAAERESARENLRTLIAQTEALIGECGVVVNGIHVVETPIALQVGNENGSYWLSTNADHNVVGNSTDGGGIAALLDGREDTYMHTQWGGTAVEDDHYVQVSLGDGLGLEEFTFTYATRKVSSSSYTSPAPTIIELYGSNDGVTFTDQIARFTSSDDTNPLKSYTELGIYWTSSNIKPTQTYDYLRFYVRESDGPNLNATTHGGHYYFAMSEFALTSITYETNYHVESLNPNGSVTEEQLLVVFNAKRAAAELANISYDKTALEEKTASLQTLYDDLQAAYDTKQVPVTLTTDHENPVLYTIKSKRGDAKAVQYEPASSHLFSIADASDGSAKQAFYFMVGDERTQVYVYPYAAGQQVLAADNTGNGAAKVFVEEKTASQAKQWTFEKETIDNVDYYSLKVVGGSTYFSQFGGGSNKMGFYTLKDDGSRMTFTETTIEGNGAYNSLKVYYDEVTKVKSSEIVSGEGVGYYTEASAGPYNLAYAAATTVLNDNTSDYAAYLATYNTLLEANEALEPNMPEVGKYYTIVSACGDNRGGQLMYATGGNEMKFGNDKAGEDTNGSWIRPEALWTFTEEGYMKNMQTGCHVGTSTWAVALTLVEKDATVVSIELLHTSDGQVLLKPGNGHPLHARVGSDIVGYINDNNASAWRIVEVDVTDVVHTVSVGQYEHTSLYLNYPVAIPEGVKAYIIDCKEGISIDADGVGTLKLTALEGKVLPAQTAVIVEAPQATYDFRYTDAPATDDVEGNLLTGSTYQTYRAAEEGHNYYIFGVGVTEGVDLGAVGLYKNFVEYTEKGDYAKEGTSNATHYKMSANKILFDWDSNEQQVASFRFSVGDDATGIDNIGTDGNAVIYDLYGRRILEVVSSGLYIINGEKRYVRVK